MSRTPKRITAQEAARILGVTGEAVRRLGNDGVISYVDVVSPEGKPTRYYFHNEIVARKRACNEYTKIADDTQSKLEEAKRLNEEASCIEEQAQRRISSSNDFFVIAERLRDILEGCLVAVNGVRPLTDRENAILGDIIHMRPMKDIARTHDITYERTRQVSVKAIRHLLRAKAIAEECAELRKENESLREENKRIKDMDTIIKENSVTLGDDELFVLSDYDFMRRKAILSDIGVLNLGWWLKSNLESSGITTVMDIVTKTRKELEDKGVQVDTLDLYMKQNGLDYNMNLAKFGIGNKERLLKMRSEDNPELLSDEEMRMKHLLLQKVVDYGLSVRAYNCLRAADIETFADLVQYTRPELQRFRNFGRKSFREIEDMLTKQHLQFGMNPRDYGIVPNPKYLR